MSICLKFAVQQTHSTGVELGHINVPPNCVREVKNSLGCLLLFPSFGSVVFLSRSVVVDRVSLLHSKARALLASPFIIQPRLYDSMRPAGQYERSKRMRMTAMREQNTRNEAIHIQVCALAQTDGSEKTENFSKPPSVIALLQTHQVENIGQRRRRNNIFSFQLYTAL